MRLLRLELFRQRRFRQIERLGGLALQILPFREILLERFRSRRRHRHSPALERKPGIAAARECLVFALQTVQEVARLLQAPRVLVAKPCEIGARTAAAALLPFARLPCLSRRLLRTGGLRRSGRAALLPQLGEIPAGSVQLLALLLHVPELLRQFPRFVVGAAARRRQLV